MPTVGTQLELNVDAETPDIGALPRTSHPAALSLSLFARDPTMRRELTASRPTTPLHLPPPDSPIRHPPTPFCTHSVIQLNMFITASAGLVRGVNFKFLKAMLPKILPLFIFQHPSRWLGGYRPECVRVQDHPLWDVWERQWGQWTSPNSCDWAGRHTTSTHTCTHTQTHTHTICEHQHMTEQIGLQYGGRQGGWSKHHNIISKIGRGGGGAGGGLGWGVYQRAGQGLSWSEVRPTVQWSNGCLVCAPKLSWCFQKKEIPKLGQDSRDEKHHK